MTISDSSSVATLSAPTLVGVWLHDVTAPSDERCYLYQTDDRVEKIAREQAALSFVGRRYPVRELGEHRSHSIDLPLKIPYSATYGTDLAWLLARVDDGATLCYRDGRGRVIFGAISDNGLAIADAVDGSTVSLAHERVDYSEAV